MSDDLVKRLRFGVALDEQGDVSWCNQEAMFKAADRIEKLEAALRKLSTTCDCWAAVEECGKARELLEKKDD